MKELKSKSMRKYRIKSVSAVIIILFAFSCGQPDMDVASNIEVPVGVFEVSKSSIEETINTTGTVFPLKEVTISSQMSGKYQLQRNPRTGKPFALGDFVREGTIIIKLEDAEYSNSLRIKSKRLDYEISKQEFEKQKSLYDKGGATLRELKNAEIGLINAEYEIESSEINLAKMIVKAPFSGVIADLPYFTNGVKIETNTPVVKIIDYEKLYLETNLPEKYYSDIAKGFKVYITSYTSPLDTLVGEITQVSPEIDAEARTFKSFVIVDNHKKVLLPGMFAKADLVINSSKDAIVIPKDIIISRNRKRFVFVVEKGIAMERSISTKLENASSIEVISGLEVGESVVSEGFETLKNKSKVKVLR
jgi:membrane fusion protein, multidrug efflux system